MDTYQNIIGESTSLSIDQMRLTRGIVDVWYANDVIDRDQYCSLIRKVYPSEVRNRFLLRAWQGLIILFFLAGISAVVAANWQNFGELARIGGVALLYIGLIIATLRQGLEKLSGKLLATSASFVSGMLIVVVTQEYQLNVDELSFYGIWCCFVFPIAVVSEFLPLWLGWVALLHITVVTMLVELLEDQLNMARVMEAVYFTLIGLAWFCLGIRKFFIHHYQDRVVWLKPRWPRFALYLSMHWFMSILYMAYFWELVSRRLSLFSSALLIAIIVGFLGTHLHFRRGGSREIWLISLSVLTGAILAVVSTGMFFFEYAIPSAEIIFLWGVIAFGIFLAAIIYVRNLRTIGDKSSVESEGVYG
ncbi:MAG: hypothetical protein CMJ76_10815 [Planctomycetaceae bacterium]|nr:hypothetical protein [Planctomycetaceae bacterium]